MPQDNPPLLDKTMNTTESTPRNLADVLAEGLSDLADSVKPSASDIPISPISGMSADDVQEGLSELKQSLSANKLSSPTSLTQVNYDYVMASDGYIKMEGGVHAGGGPVVRVYGSDKGNTYIRLYKITDVQTYGDSLCFFVRKGMIIVVEQFASNEGTVTYYPLTN